VDTRFSYYAITCLTILGKLETIDLDLATDFVANHRIDSVLDVPVAIHTTNEGTKSPSLTSLSPPSSRTLNEKEKLCKEDTTSSVSSIEAPSVLAGDDTHKTWKESTQPTITLKYSKRIVADLIFSKETSQKISSFVSSSTYLRPKTWMCTLLTVLCLLILFGKVPIEYSYLYLVSAICWGSLILTINIEVFFYLLQSWDFLYWCVQIIIFVIEFGLLFPDHRAVLGVSVMVCVLVSSCVDALPSSINRRFGFSIWINATIFYSIMLAGFHYSLFPNIVDYQVHFYSTVWEVRQMIETLLFAIIVWAIRFCIFGYLYPKDIVFFKFNVAHFE